MEKQHQGGGAKKDKETRKSAPSHEEESKKNWRILRLLFIALGVIGCMIGIVAGVRRLMAPSMPSFELKSLQVQGKSFGPFGPFAEGMWYSKFDTFVMYVNPNHIYTSYMFDIHSDLFYNGTLLTSSKPHSYVLQPQARGFGYMHAGAGAEKEESIEALIDLVENADKNPDELPKLKKSQRVARSKDDDWAEEMSRDFNRNSKLQLDFTMYVKIESWNGMWGESPKYMKVQCNNLTLTYNSSIRRMFGGPWPCSSQFQQGKDKVKLMLS